MRVARIGGKGKNVVAKFGFSVKIDHRPPRRCHFARLALRPLATPDPILAKAGIGWATPTLGGA